MKKTLIIILAIFITISIKAQESYQELVAESTKLYKAKEYVKSAELLDKAIQMDPDSENVSNKYNAACIWALAKKPEKAFKYLYEISKKVDYDWLIKDTDFESIHNDRRWDEITHIAEAEKVEREKKFDKPLVAQLSIIHDEDQLYRNQINSVSDEFGWKSDEMKKLWKVINEKDSLNLIAIEKILAEHGWLSKDIIGKEGNSTLFLVIQHADIETQLKYLPMMREAVTNGNADASCLALLEDRTALRTGKLQIYGSQITKGKDGVRYVMPLIDPDNVDKRRASVGLPPLANYIANWDMDWDVEAYKKNLPDYIKTQEERNKKK